MGRVNRKSSLIFLFKKIVNVIHEKEWAKISLVSKYQAEISSWKLT